MSTSNPKATTSCKDSALDFLRLAASGAEGTAFERHVAAEFRHHNPAFAGDAESLMRAMQENSLKNPDKILEVRHAVEEGDLVAVHSLVRMRPGDPGIAVVHLFRFENGRIAELWDIAQPVPEKSPNQHGMF
jgi:predicted SnoaL-like aldol condensation-catalyzing enzyme